MNTLHRTLILGVASVGLGVAAMPSFAEPSTSVPTTHHAGRLGTHADRFAERMAKREVRLHDRLKLTAAQEPAWTAFVDEMKSTAGPRPQMRHGRSLTAPQGAERMAELMKVRAQQAADRVAPIKEFYATLLPEQRKIFDDQSQPHHHHFGERR